MPEYMIRYGSTTSLFGYPNVMRNGIPHRGPQKDVEIEAPGATISRNGIHMVSQGSPRGSQILNKLIRKCGPAPGVPPKAWY